MAPFYTKSGRWGYHKVSAMVDGGTGDVNDTEDGEKGGGGEGEEGRQREEGWQQGRVAAIGAERGGMAAVGAERGGMKKIRDVMQDFFSCHGLGWIRRRTSLA